MVKAGGSSSAVASPRLTGVTSLRAPRLPSGSDNLKPASDHTPKLARHPSAFDDDTDFEDEYAILRDLEAEETSMKVFLSLLD